MCESVGARLSPSEPARARWSPYGEPVGSRSPLGPKIASPSASEPVGKQNQDHGLGARGITDSRAPRSLGMTLVDIVIADPTRRDLVDRAAERGLVAPEDAERRKEAH